MGRDEGSRPARAGGVHYALVILGMSVLVVTGALGFARFGPRLIISLSLMLVGATMLLIGTARTFGGALRPPKPHPEKGG